MPENRPTQRALAEFAGVSRSTVTRALRDDPQISLVERKRIQALAKQIGYRPNPMIDALMTQVRTGKQGEFRSVLGWIAHGWQETDWRREARRRRLFQAARERANALGYDLQPFFPKDVGQTPGALLRMLSARGIRGLLLDDTAGEASFQDWEFSQFVAVTVGYRLGQPALHFLANDLFAATWSLLHSLRARGFERPALALDSAYSQYTQFRIIGGFHAFQCATVPIRERVEVWKSATGTKFEDWMAQTNPDVLIVDHANFFSRGRKRPAGISVAAVETEKGMAGMFLDPTLLGSAAVELVTAHLIRNDIGVPTAQKGVMLEARFLWDSEFTQ